MVKRCGIAKKPVDKSASDWVSEGGVDPEISEPKAAEPKAKSKKPLPKSKDPNYSQIGLYLPKELHQKMKIGAAITGLEMSVIAEAGIQMWLDENVPDK